MIKSPSQRIVRVRTPHEEFEAAEEGGYVFGRLVRQSPLPTYIELGTERDYILSPKDDKKKSEVRSQKSEVKMKEKTLVVGLKPTKIKRFMSRHEVRDIIIPYFKPTDDAVGKLADF